MNQIGFSTMKYILYFFLVIIISSCNSCVQKQGPCPECPTCPVCPECPDTSGNKIIPLGNPSEPGNPSCRELAFNGQFQIMDKWCWAASISSIAHYFQENVTQIRLAQEENKIRNGNRVTNVDSVVQLLRSNTCNTSPSIINEALPCFDGQYSLGRNFQYMFNKFRFEAMEDTTKFLWKEIVHDIDQGFPFIWVIGDYLSSVRNLHAVVVIGYCENSNEKWVKVFDPYSPCATDMGGSPNWYSYPIESYGSNASANSYVEFIHHIRPKHRSQYPTPQFITCFDAPCADNVTHGLIAHIGTSNRESFLNSNHIPYLKTLVFSQNVTPDKFFASLNDIKFNDYTIDIIASPASNNSFIRFSPIVNNKSRVLSLRKNTNKVNFEKYLETIVHGKQTKKGELIRIEYPLIGELVYFLPKDQVFINTGQKIISKEAMKSFIVKNNSELLGKPK